MEFYHFHLRRCTHSVRVSTRTEFNGRYCSVRECNRRLAYVGQRRPHGSRTARRRHRALSISNRLHHPHRLVEPHLRRGTAPAEDYRQQVRVCIYSSNSNASLFLSAIANSLNRVDQGVSTRINYVAPKLQIGL